MKLEVQTHLKRLKVSEVAKQFGLSTTAIYKHLKRFQTHLKDHVTKEGGITLVTEEGVNILRESLNASTVSSREITPAIAVQDPGQTSRFDGIEKSLLVMAEKMTGLVEMNKAILEENRLLRLEVAKLQNRIEYKPPEPKAQPLAIKEPSFSENISHAIRETQIWLRGVLSPFVEVFKGG